MGIGRTRYYYGKPRSKIHVSFNPLDVYEFTEQCSRRASLIRSQIKSSTVHSIIIYAYFVLFPRDTTRLIVDHEKSMSTNGAKPDIFYFQSCVQFNDMHNIRIS